ncbi:unnamed protein product, partial [Coregonus sp. 'balchen']
MATLKEKRTCGQRCEDFGRFVWNSDTGTMFGRTPEKWVYISLYYVAFYVIMTGLFSLAIWTLIPMSDKASQRKMSNCLSNFLKPYNDTSQQSNCNCTRGEYFKQEKFEAPHHTKYSCRFTQSMLGRCSGLDDPMFGYNGTMPCVIIKMNRIINFLPNNGTGMAPHLNCTILSGHANIDMIEYFPPNGTFDLSYFPYYGKLAQGGEGEGRRGMEAGEGWREERDGGRRGMEGGEGCDGGEGWRVREGGRGGGRRGWREERDG